jgi:carbamoyltransferase
MEFGPRALGCRSIIGDARSRDMQSVMNLKIKFRESFRPFAPIVLREHVSDWFEMGDNEDSPYMLLVADVAEGRRQMVDDDGFEGLDKLKLIRSDVPAITHVDNSARVQTVDPTRHARLHRLMTVFSDRTGCPVMINTSFNVRGEPIVCSPVDAYHCFMGTDMDVLVLENCLLLKEEQPEGVAPDRDTYLAQFELD